MNQSDTPKASSPLIEAMLKHALESLTNSKVPLFAYPGAHFYLQANGDLLSSSRKPISRRDTALHAISRLQQHLLAYPAPKSAEFHVVAIACNKDQSPHCAINKPPAEIHICMSKLGASDTKPVVRVLTLTKTGYEPVAA